jgi:DNA-binding transcriptional LysR family regulator
MQRPNWNDLRYLLAVRRGQTLAAAARLLGVDDTTVSRRLAALQAALRTQLVRRQGADRLVVTKAGELVARRTEAMEQHFRAISEVAGVDQLPVRGTVRITSVPILINRVFARAVGCLLEDHPGLIVELTPESRDLSLTRREADIAVRLARPSTGGAKVRTRRIGALLYAAYAPAALSPREARRLPWITFDDAMSHLPQPKWIARAVKGGSGNVSGLRVHDAETALEAAVAGVGRTLLPVVVADRDARLRRLATDAHDDGQLPRREIWLMTHSEDAELSRISAAASWIEKAVAVDGRFSPETD